MLVQPQQAATVCELDPVQHTIGSAKRAQTLDPNQPPENSYDPLNLTLDLEYAHVSGHSANYRNGARRCGQALQCLPRGFGGKRAKTSGSLPRAGMIRPVLTRAGF